MRQYHMGDIVVFDCMLSWIENHPALAYWAQGTAIFFTGVFAYLAARKAYKGAIAQSEATLMAVKTQHEREITGTTVVVIAELHAVSIILVKHILITNLRPSRGKYTSVSLPNSFQVLDSDPLVLAKLAPTSVRSVSVAYQTMRVAIAARKKAFELEANPAKDMLHIMDLIFVQSVLKAGEAIRSLSTDIEMTDLYDDWVKEFETEKNRTPEFMQIWSKLEAEFVGTNN